VPLVNAFRQLASSLSTRCCSASLVLPAAAASGANMRHGESLINSKFSRSAKQLDNSTTTKHGISAGVCHTDRKKGRTNKSSTANRATPTVPHNSEDLQLRMSVMKVESPRYMAILNVYVLDQTKNNKQSQKREQAGFIKAILQLRVARIQRLAESEWSVLRALQ
jgi:hypothetical protein